MKKFSLLFVAASFTLFLLVSGKYKDKNPYGFELGTPQILSVTSLTFGPEGILFIGDSKGASIFAIDTKDKVSADKAPAVQLKNIDQTIAAYLGTEAKNISIKDLAVNPVSKKIYCAIQAMDGTPALLTIDGDKIQAVNLKEVMFSVVAIENAPAADAKNQRGRPMREMSISDLLYADNSIMVSGILTRNSDPLSEKSLFHSLVNKIILPLKFIMQPMENMKRLLQYRRLPLLP